MKHMTEAKDAAGDRAKHITEGLAADNRMDKAAGVTVDGSPAHGSRHSIQNDLHPGQKRFHGHMTPSQAHGQGGSGQHGHSQKTDQNVRD
jgi:hypothetical protein